jgi:hypothetical protein
MSEPCRITQGLFDRWYIFHPTMCIPYLAWSGRQWVAASEGLPTGNVQVCNFPTEQEAREYCREHRLDPQ